MGTNENCAEAPPCMNRTLKLGGIDINSRRSASASRRHIEERFAAMADFHDRHAAALPIEQFVARLLQDLERQHGRARREVENAHGGEVLRVVGGWIGRLRILASSTLALARQAFDALETGELIALFQPDQAHTLGVASHHGNILHRRAHQHAVLAHQHDLIVQAHLQRAHHDSVAVGNLQGDHALAAAAMLREILERRQFAETVLRCRENEAVLATISALTRCSSLNFTPRTPAASRPIGRTSSSRKRIALPAVVNSSMSLVPSVIATPTSLSPGSSATAMMPLARGRENSASEVFLTVPRLVAMKTNFPSSNSLMDSMALMRSPS